MYLISLNPDEYDLNGGETLFVCPTQAHIDQRVKLLNQKYPGRSIFVFKITQKLLIEATYTTKVYNYNEKGEVLPA